jgi:serine/threonine-protein kinase
MEYVPGDSLAELAGGRRMRPSRAIPILRSVAEALDHAHDEGVVHRDVKPGNIMVGDDGTVKLADLGIARAVGSSQITSEGSVVGTLPYMSPERLEGPGSGGPESDVYALAAVAYELLSGRPPSNATSSEEAAAGPPPDLRRDWPKAPPAAAEVLERALDPDPDARQPSAGTFVDELDAALKGEAKTRPVGAAAAGGVTEPTARMQTQTALERLKAGGREGSPNRGLAIGLAALAVLAIAGIAIGSGGGDSDGGDEQEAAAVDKPAKDPKEEPAPAPPPEEPAAPAADDPVALNDLGFSLINEGRYEEAIPILERAVAAAEGTEGLTYPYALFNLGHALRMAGRPEEAIPILEQRLEFPDQTEEVQRELDAAYAAAGQGEDFEEEDGGPGNGNGKAKGHDKNDGD